ncbi:MULTISPECIES: site-specific DNA-methyltransferase [Methylorubrum]|uniref:site-specific DNA-methyltransferase n=1 Tax=Methylorubrum TaxID=2282523 RepID=UPI00209E62A2|nr:adenine-specific DNA-methyltransferase [Methylorubrum extorquens]
MLDSNLGTELEQEFKAIASRRAFGLNFERHQPETVELSGRAIRKGSKVRILPERGTLAAGAAALWRVQGIEGVGTDREGVLTPLDTPSAPAVRSSIRDLVAVAEFRDSIYPGLVSTGSSGQGGDKPCHVVINGENYHALQALLFTHRACVDVIYIDPPYNSGAQDWKYNNNYVEKDDLYRHSKWLAMMERRLLLAADLLKPDNSVMIVAIDDKEVARLSLLLEQVFPQARIEMITSVINPRGKYRQGEFGRCEEYLFFVAFGQARVLGEPDEDFGTGAHVAWRTLRRSDLSSRRGTPKGGTGQFFPIYVDASGAIRAIGDALPHSVPRSAVPGQPGCTTVFPMRDDGTEMNWGLTAPSLKGLIAKGYVRVGRHTPSKAQPYEISYLTSGRIEDIESGRAQVVGANPDGSVIARYVTHKVKMPTSTWLRQSHNAEIYGTDLLKALIGERNFPFPKSLHAVEDCLRLYIADKPNAVVLDFFSGSGTTAHAVMRLNRQDGGRRQSISVTNNEVGPAENAALRMAGHRPGDPEWEAQGICELITKPRIRAAIEGKRPDGSLLEGEYKANDSFPMADGFQENAEFFTLTYETEVTVKHDLAFERIAPLLWMRAGSQGRRIDAIPTCGWDVAETYAILSDLDQASIFYKAIAGSGIRICFIVTDDDGLFQSVAGRLPAGVEPVRLYEAYLSNFRMSAGR